MTPADYARLAERAYSAKPLIGDADGAARAIAEQGAVAFPGTDNLACWLADLDVRTKTVPGMGAVHCGFHDAFSEIAVPLMALPDVEVTVGHSEGGALAILFAAARCLAGCPPKAVYAFEPPRVSADSVLGSLFKTHGVEVRLYRNGEDLVPLIPRILHNWQHPAPLIQIGEASLPFPNIEDHGIERIVAALG